MQSGHHFQQTTGRQPVIAVNPVGGQLNRELLSPCFLLGYVGSFTPTFITCAAVDLRLFFFLLGYVGSITPTNGMEGKQILYYYYYGINVCKVCTITP